MGKYKIDNAKIQECFGITKEFDNVNEFCDYLDANKEDANCKNDIKKWLSITGLKNTGVNLNQRNVLIINWIRANCYFGNETKKNEKLDTIEVLPKIDYEKVKKYYEETDYKRVKQLDESDLDYTEGIVLKENGIINQQNHVELILYRENLEIDCSKLLIIEEKGNVVFAVGFLEQDIENKNIYKVIVDDSKYIDYEKFKSIRQARFILYEKNGQPYSRLFELKYEPYDIEKERPLCIDFGTSNTAVGCYGILDRKKDETEIVKFIDVTVSPNNTNAVLLPTVVYVEDCSDTENIKYLFGYEARKRIEEEHYESKASVFYEIKRWILSVDEREEIRDNENHRANPTRGDIIKAYLDYVIKYAEQYFGTRFQKIHFSAPVKLKNESIKVFTKMYKDEKIVLSPEESIDEGIAIVYNQIITLIADEHAKQGKENEKSIMIMDCGGGTTDLASCNYEFERTEAGVTLNLKTCFENGNVNFGGNNITYRIMQLLKIKIAAAFSKGMIDNDGETITLISKSENEILGLVEEGMSKNAYDSDSVNSEIYDKFMANYKKAEEIIPTQYIDNKKHRGTEALKKIKRNFYYLWRKAEQIKIEFFRTETVIMDFHKRGQDAILNIENNNDNYYIYVVQDNKLQRKEQPFSGIKITIKEINRVICADIYSLLVGLFRNGKLTSQGKMVDSFNYYKLSGQSCKISLFSDLIKEYIPGRKFRPAKINRKNVEKKSEDLKLDCVLGCINYVKDQIRPEMKVNLEIGLPEIIYNVYLKGTHSEDKKLFDCQNVNYIEFAMTHVNTKEIPLMITGRDDIREREFIVQLRDVEDRKLENWNTEDIKKKLMKSSIVSENGIDDFLKRLTEIKYPNNEVVNIIFVVPGKEGYGINIAQLQALGNEDGVKYKFIQYKHENFENTSKTFFDGHR